MTVAYVELPGLTRESAVSVRVVRALLEIAERRGLSRSELLRAAQLSSEVLDAPDAWIPRSTMYQICELALDLTGDPALGLHWAERLGEHSFVPISHLIVHAATLRQSFDALANFYRLFSDQPSYQFIEQEGKMTVRYQRMPGESLRVQRLASEMMVVGFFRLVRCFSPDARPEQVCFDYAAPPYESEYQRLLDNAARFDQPFTGVVLDSALLDLPAPNKDEDVHEALLALAERRLLHITKRMPYALRVRDFLVRYGWRERSDMESVAHALGLSVRSLRRRLSEEGKSYAAVSNEALGIVAKHLLRDKQRTIQETAYEMGFSDASAFHRAFKRWTGTTPSVFRGEQAPR
jgi:AraC-like DNA-binding protein